MTPDDLQFFMLGAIFGACCCGFAWWTVGVCDLVGQLARLLRRGSR